VQYRGHAAGDKVGRVKVDLIDLVFRELALTGVNVLQRHQEDHRSPRLFVTLNEQALGEPQASKVCCGASA
jgi:hypothetical protein